MSNKNQTAFQWLEAQLEEKGQPTFIYLLTELFKVAKEIDKDVESEHNRIVSELKAENEWISVNNNLPEFDGKYLCVVLETEECGEIYQRQYILENSFNHWVNTTGNVIEVTHWKKLPLFPNK